MLFTRKSGILLHPTSLPGKYGIGTLGKEAFSFIDFLIKSGQRIWQTCPLGPTGYGDSPYQCFSAFAGNPLLIDLELLVKERLLTTKDITPDKPFPEDHVDYGRLFQWKYPILKKAYVNFIKKNDPVEIKKFERFTETNKSWLEDYSLFMSIKDSFNGKPWSEWPSKLKTREPHALSEHRVKLAKDVEYYDFMQYIFFKQWKALKAYANTNYITVIGDIPLYVAYDSADAWANPEMFLFDKDSNPTCVAGVPPDYFSATGQMWGNPIYDWERMKKDGFKWWIARLRGNLELSDIIRFDHFRGLLAYWSIPYGDKTAENGKWERGCGEELFAIIHQELGEIPMIAEDLGIITDDVVALRERYSLPSMKILQFAFDSLEASSKTFIPHVYNQRCVVYTGTHDNDTAQGWFNAAKKIDKDYVRKYLNITGNKVSFSFIRSAWSSTAMLAIAPMQDVLSLDSSSRMNTPGTPSGNWMWRYKANKITPKIISDLAEITKLYGRSFN